MATPSFFALIFCQWVVIHVVRCQLDVMAGHMSCQVHYRMWRTLFVLFYLCEMARWLFNVRMGYLELGVVSHGLRCYTIEQTTLGRVWLTRWDTYKQSKQEQKMLVILNWQNLDTHPWKVNENELLYDKPDLDRKKMLFPYYFPNCGIKKLSTSH